MLPLNGGYIVQPVPTPDSTIVEVINKGYFHGGCILWPISRIYLRILIRIDLNLMSKDY